MKKSIISTVLFLTLFCGCTAQKNPQPVTAPVSSQETMQAEYKTIEKTDNKSRIENLSKFQDCSYDFDRDDVEETITLYTSAKKDSSGEFMWDDSQDWVLAVEGNNGIYILSDMYMHGKNEIFLSENYNEDGSDYPSVRLMISSGSGFEIREYTFENNVFKEKTVYNAGELNELSVNQY